MIYFHPGTHALFLLTLCLLAPLGGLVVISALTAASRLRHRGDELSYAAGLALTGGPSSGTTALDSGADASAISEADRAQIGH